MAYKGVVDDFKAIRGKKLPSRIPCTAASEEFDVRWHGKYTYEEFCQDGEKIFEVTKAAVEHFDYDWAWVQIDDCFEFEPIGVGVKGEGNILRGTYRYLPVEKQVLTRVETMDPNHDGRLPEKLKALEKLKAYFGDTVLVTGSCAAPFSAIGLMWSIEESMTLMLTDSALLHEAMECWKNFYVRYIKAQKDAGADAIWLGDCNAFSSMVSVDLYKEHILPITRDLIEYCEKNLDIMMWMHNSEIHPDHVRSHFPLGYSFENIGPDADIKEIRDATKGIVSISGNIDPIKVLWKGTPELVEQEVERIIATCKEGGGFIFSSGEMVPRETPEENISAMVKAVRRLGAY
jgi:[methyl-Co(III) methylamine-specific corrinoid protein]:coenzyme M methyltransferase